MSDPPEDPARRRLAIGDRIRYRFDNLLARGTWAALAWLGVLTLVAVLVSAVLLAVFRVTFTGSQGGSFIEDFWQSLLRVMDPGTMAGDVGWGRRVLALLITVFGLLVAGTLIGIIAAGVEDRVERMRRGRSVVFERDHVVVLGASERLPVVVHQLVLANSRRSGSAIVIMADRDSRDMYEEVHGVVSDRLGTHLVFRSGDPTRRSDLELVGLPQARAVIVLADELQGDPVAIKTVIAIGAELGGFDRIPIVVELGDPANGEYLVRACGESVHPLIPAQAVARTAAFALREPGTGQVITDLLDFKGADVHITAQPQLVGSTFGAAVSRYSKARPIGIMHADSKVDLNPPPASRFVKDDRLIAICDDIESLELVDDAKSWHSPDQPADPNLDIERDRERLLVLGWNSLGAAMLADWAHFASRDSAVEMLIDHRLVDHEDVSLSEELGRIASHTPITNLPDLTARLSSAPPVTTVILLGYSGSLSTAEADARTLLDLVAIRRELATLDGHPPRVVVQLLDADNITLAEIDGPDDFIISQAIGSQMLAQLADQPERRTVFLELYGAVGPSLHMVPVEQIGLAGNSTGEEIARSSYEAGLLAIGWRSRRTGVLALNPDMSDLVHLETGDQIVVIA